MVTDSNKLLGQALGTCTLQRLIGRGGMGAVYLAQQSRPRRTVAVKVLMPGTFLEQRPQAEFLARFRREADAIAALDHINIMPIYEYGEQEDLAYLVMPYVTGGTLSQKLDKRGKLPLEQIFPILDQVASGLDFAHAQGIIHRDLKPGNILFHADGRVLLADFGLAKMINGTTGDEEGPHVTMTTTGTIIGTPEYLAPEQGTGKAVDCHTDIYSLGIVLYRMLTGRVPFIGASPVAVAIKHAMEDPPSLTSIDPTIPHSVEAVVMKAIAKKPEERFDSAGELARALHNAISDNHEQTLPISTSISLQETIGETPITLTTEDGWQEEQTEDIHSQQTEETPLLTPKTLPDKLPTTSETGKPQPAAMSQKQTVEQVQIEDAATITEAPEKLPKPQEKRAAVRMAAQAPIAERSRPEMKAQRGCQSIGMMLLGSALTLILVIGGFIWYLQPWITHRIVTPPVKPTAAARATAQSTPAPPPGPAISAGPRLYGTTFPGENCDKQGGKWTITAGAAATCGSGALTLSNKGSGNIEGMLFDTLPDGSQLPQNYIVQLQVDTSANTHGDFGVFFRTQSGQASPSYIFLINLAEGIWQVNVYGGGSLVSPEPLVPAKLNGIITIDVVVRGSNPEFFINGARQGGTAGLGVTTGSFGLAVSPGAAMAIKNVTVYALS